MNFSSYHLLPLNHQSAHIISRWSYPPPYQAYSFAGQNDTWLMDASTWGTEQFYLTDGISVAAQVACQFFDGEYWVGWSLAPQLCGQGNGHRFVLRCLQELHRLLPLTDAVYLRVAASNARAVKAYQRAGFVYFKTIIDEIAYSNHPEDFFVMKYTFKQSQ